MGKTEDAAYKAWLEDLKEDIEKFEDPEDRAAAERLMKNETFGKRVAKGVVGSKELYRRFNEVNEEKLKLKEEHSTWSAWRDEVNTKFQQALNENASLKEELERRAQLAEEFGLDDEARDLRRQKKAVDADSQKELRELKAQLETMDKGYREELSKLANGVPGFVAAALKTSKRLAKEGFEVEDDDAISLAMAKGVPVESAYEELIKDQREKKNKADLEKRLAEAREAGRQEALTARSDPEKSRPSSGIFMAPSAGRDKWDEGLKAAREAARMDALKMGR